MNCPECHNELKPGQNSCMCGYRLKPKEPAKPKYKCRQCEHTKYLHRCGPDHAPFYLCSDHWRDFQENLAEAQAERQAIMEEPDMLQDMADGLIK